jgi:hypothetical protein
MSNISAISWREFFLLTCHTDLHVHKLKENNIAKIELIHYN